MIRIKIRITYYIDQGTNLRLPFCYNQQHHNIGCSHMLLNRFIGKEKYAYLIKTRATMRRYLKIKCNLYWYTVSSLHHITCLTIMSGVSKKAGTCVRIFSIFTSSTILTWIGFTFIDI